MIITAVIAKKKKSEYNESTHIDYLKRFRK
jgi:hypothetical protein